VHLDGSLIFSLDKAEHFPEASELIEAIRTRMPTDQG
jgi:hypothetical protein